MALDGFEKENFDIIVLAGQSNAEGNGRGEAAEEYIPDPRVLMMTDHASPYYKQMEDGRSFVRIHYPTERSIAVAEEAFNGIGKLGQLALFFAREYIANGRLQEGRKLLILHTAIGDTGFRDEQWGLDNTLYERTKSFTRDALALGGENRLVAFLWHQGESQVYAHPEWSPEKRTLVHARNLSDMILDFKQTFSRDDIPFIAAAFCEEWYAKNKAPCDAILGAIEEVFSQHGVFLTTSELTSNNQKSGDGDDIHFSRDALHRLGKKYYRAYHSFTR